jgi:hypothetical protein
MLLYKKVKPELLDQLKEGSFFENAIVTAIVRKNNYISVTTSAGDVYNFHYKPEGYSVFHHRKDLKEIRLAREKAKKSNKG